MARILIVEDVRFISQVLASFFEKRGHTVGVAADGAQALLMARMDMPELILSDISMPKMDGLEVARRLKGDPVTAVIPIIMVTSRADAEAMAEANEAGVDEYMRKPFEMDSLIERATRLLGGFPMNYSVARIGETPVLTALNPELADEAAGHLGSAVEAARAAGTGALLLDFSRVEKVESGCVDTVLGALKSVAPEGSLLPAVEPAAGMGVRAFRDRLGAQVEWHADRVTALQALGIPADAPERPVRLGAPAPGSVAAPTGPAKG